jgi:hypothetical protein
MDWWSVLVWNMGLMSPGSRKAARNMAYLDELVKRHAVRIALLNEASVAYLRAANARAAIDRGPAPYVFSETGIRGRDFWTDQREVRKLKDRKRWSSAVMSPLGPHLLREEDVRAIAPSRRNPTVDIPSTNSRPGTWIAATVRTDEESITCVSLYGLIEELTDASMHRSLSEISPIFSDPEHKERVLLGGDFNISTGLADASARERSRIVLNRIEAYDLEDCVATWHGNNDLPPTPGCRCDDQPCRHILTRLTPNQLGADVPWPQRDRSKSTTFSRQRLSSNGSRRSSRSRRRSGSATVTTDRSSRNSAIGESMSLPHRCSRSR